MNQILPSTFIVGDDGVDVVDGVINYNDYVLC